MMRLYFEGKPSLLCKIYSLFEVHLKGEDYYYVIMENLFYNIKSPDIVVYDLKGSESNRWEKNRGKTLLDTNYKLD